MSPYGPPLEPLRSPRALPLYLTSIPHHGASIFFRENKVVITFSTKGGTVHCQQIPFKIVPDGISRKT